MALRPAALALSLLGSSAAAQDVVLERVDIVGSRIPRIDAEHALPVQVIRRDEIERSGATNAEELLDLVSANFGGFREALGLGNSDTPGLSGASLRGFGTGETLVLLNGRRLANYAFTSSSGPGVDLHVIPLAAIDRVEILKDGASALYGSDAIAGVINFVTRHDFAGATLASSYRAPEHGGGERSRASAAWGGGNYAADGFNLFGVLDVQDTRRLRATDRSFAATSYRPELGLDGTAPASFPANIVIHRGPGGPVLRTPAAPDCTPETVFASNGCLFDPAKTLDLIAPSQQTTFLGRGTLRLMDDAEAYTEVLVATNRIRFTSSPSPVSTITSQSGSSFLLPVSSAYYPTGLGLTGPLQLAFRTTQLGPRTSDVASDNVRLLLGIKTQKAGWNIDAAVADNNTRARETFVSGYVDAGHVQAALGTGLVNPFGPSGPDGDGLIAASELRGPSRKAGGRTDSADLHASRELMPLPGGMLGLATGIELRRESLHDEQSAIAADVSGEVPAAPKDASRRVQAAYVETVAPLIKGFEVQVAARLDHYSDFGTSVSPKIALRLQPTPTWLARASLGRGFRAPSLPELYTQQTTGQDFADVPDPARCPTTGVPADCLLEVPLTIGGNPALKPQRSVQASAGIVVEPARGWQASLDFWSIRIADIIGTLNPNDVVNNIAQYEGKNVIRGPVDPAFPNLPGPIVRFNTINENLGDWRVTGADLSLAMQPAPTPLGRFSARLDGTYVAHARQNIFAGNQVDLIGRVVPRWQHLLTFNLDRGPWTTTLSYRYRCGYPDEQPLPDGSTRRVAAYQVWDGQLGFAFSRDVQLSLGVRNLFDTAPPFSNQRSSFQVGYDPSYADPLGRTWILALRLALH